MINPLHDDKRLVARNRCAVRLGCVALGIMATMRIAFGG
jgi:hypothetical protein